MLVDDFRAELVAVKAAVVAPLEGLRDLLQLDDLTAEARQALGALREHYDTLRIAVENGIGACDRLLAEGYPTLPDATLIAGAYASVQAQVDTIAAAFAKLRPEPEAAGGSITFGAPEPK